MALVKVLVANLFAGVSLQKLEAGQVYDVDDSIAEKWIEQGKVEKSTEKKGESSSLKWRHLLRLWQPVHPICSQNSMMPLSS
ncbi:hypothetical protein [Enterobacter hormaechei]|uniref:hypothetical protein n=1 Tax=Enterobacter hormaechei TaxID=158836 RepID=UPI001D15DDBC|nr:hypothetical protein [Enterobacter hormaechei]